MKTILLVDDESGVLSYLEDTLSTFGYNVIPKPDAQSALSVIREGTKVDLVMTDYSMPGMGSHEYFTALRQALPSVPIIILTGYGSADIEGKLHSIGRFEYVTKPVDARELGRIVKAALERSAA
jgi:two-component system response regulator HydG